MLRVLLAGRLGWPQPALMRAVLVSHLAATYGMVAVIWFVQLVHYPLFARVGVRGFAQYEARHRARISWIVVPLMLLELGTAIALVWPAALAWAPRWERVAGLTLVAAAWAVTFALSVPEHARLSGGFDLDSWRRLVSTNWLRTLAWSARGALVTGWIWRALG